ncbi:MAG: PIN domain-containing protein [Saprospiraceae bacterium]|nr:PIN domain-containing protein [Saprospiraceae bacterium]
MNADKIFVDSNIFLYILDNALEKRKKAFGILSNRPIISPQVVFENINVAIKKFGYSKIDALTHGHRLLRNCTLILDTEKTVQRAFDIFQKDTVQVYDSRIVASALEADCIPRLERI